MLKEHLAILRCPLSGEKLNLIPEEYGEDGHIESGKLVSSANTYPISKGIPRFVLPQSEKEMQTIKAFGDQWCKAADCGGTYGQDSEYFAAYLYPLLESEFKNSNVLDAGCGNGRLTEYVGKFAPKVIVGLDYSDSVELAFSRTRHFPNVLIVQGSILSPPLRRNHFDIVFSLGVIHHLENPGKGLYELGNLLKDDGKMHVWTYSREGNEIYLALVKALRWIAQKTPGSFQWHISLLLALISWPYLWACYHMKNKFPAVPLFMRDYLCFIYELGFNVYKLVIHDQLVPQIALYPSKNEIHSWVSRANLQIFHLDMRTGNSWRIGLKK